MKLRSLFIVSVLGVSLFTAKDHISSKVDASPVETSYNETIREEIIINDKDPIKASEELLRDKNQTNHNSLDSLLVLVNKSNSLPSDYKPEDLTVPNVSFSFTGPHEKQNMRFEAAKALEKLFNAAAKEDMTLYAVSGFRSYSRQQTVYHGHVQSLGAEEADKISAKPGHSEHQTGLAMDITSRSAGMSLSESFGDTPEGIWVAENAHKFGFIIRYQKGKAHLTGYSYEPWHLRYVGIEAATKIMERDLILEEYIEGGSM